MTADDGPVTETTVERKNGLAVPEEVQVLFAAKTATQERTPEPPANPTFTTIATKAQRAQEEIQKRKALWSKDKPTTSTGLWSATAFSEDQDGKVSAKFKRLMGIKGAEEASGSQEKPAEDLIKKQQELFANLDAQYAVARATTHTQRGLGLGFGSQNFHH
nr:EOG090X0LFN [Triops cancriformis]